MQAVNSTGWFAELLATHQAPCVSIYFPTMRAEVPQDQNDAHFRGLLDNAQQMLEAKYQKDQWQPVIERLQNLPEQYFGEGPRDAVAVFASQDFDRVIDLQRPVDELVIVADSFHVKPLIRTMQFGDRFSVLCFGIQNVRVAEGNQYQLSDVPVRNLPKGIHEASLQENTRANSGGRGAGAPPLHAEPAPDQIQTMQLEPFMKLIDQRVWENYSRDRHLPMVVIADPQHLGNFLAATKNPYMLEQGVAINPNGLDGERLRAEAWKIIEPRYREEIKRLQDQFHIARSQQKGSDAIPDVAEAAAVGRVGTLLVDADRQVPGVLHRESGVIEPPSNTHTRGGDDVLDDLAEMVLRMDGQVYVLPHDQMPTDAGVAAMYRY